MVDALHHIIVLGSELFEKIGMSIVIVGKFQGLQKIKVSRWCSEWHRRKKKADEMEKTYPGLDFGNLSEQIRVLSLQLLQLFLLLLGYRIELIVSLLQLGTALSYGGSTVGWRRFFALGLRAL
jgi:hypothetical protein